MLSSLFFALFSLFSFLSFISCVYSCPIKNLYEHVPVALTPPTTQLRSYFYDNITSNQYFIFESNYDSQIYSKTKMIISQKKIWRHRSKGENDDSFVFGTAESRILGAALASDGKHMYILTDSANNSLLQISLGSRMSIVKTFNASSQYSNFSSIALGAYQTGDILFLSVLHNGLPVIISFNLPGFSLADFTFTITTSSGLINNLYFDNITQVLYYVSPTVGGAISGSYPPTTFVSTSLSNAYSILLSWNGYVFISILDNNTTKLEICYASMTSCFTCASCPPNVNYALSGTPPIFFTEHNIMWPIGEDVSNWHWEIHSITDSFALRTPYFTSNIQPSLLVIQVALTYTGHGDRHNGYTSTIIQLSLQTANPGNYSLNPVEPGLNLSPGMDGLAALVGSPTGEALFAASPSGLVAKYILPPRRPELPIEERSIARYGSQFVQMVWSDSVSGYGPIALSARTSPVGTVLNYALEIFTTDLNDYTLYNLPPGFIGTALTPYTNIVLIVGSFNMLPSAIIFYLQPPSYIMTNFTNDPVATTFTTVTWDEFGQYAYAGTDNGQGQRAAVWKLDSSLRVVDSIPISTTSDPVIQILFSSNYSQLYALSTYSLSRIDPTIFRIQESIAISHGYGIAFENVTGSLLLLNGTYLGSIVPTLSPELQLVLALPLPRLPTNRAISKPVWIRGKLYYGIGPPYLGIGGINIAECAADLYATFGSSSSITQVEIILIGTLGGGFVLIGVLAGVAVFLYRRRKQGLRTGYEDINK